ncbi:hypothetical protein MN608_00736 [Microdochium nivale]|nr:hypothetical protein MN608_00736 [Microdochium nivale]
MPAAAAAVAARQPPSEAGPPLSSSSSPSSSTSAAVVISNPQTHPSPLHPRPLIRELLRTRYAAPGAVLLVEAVDAAHTSATGRWRAVRLLLGDGELCVQALLAAELHGYVDTGEIAVGTYLRLDEFKLEHRTLPSANGGSGSGRDGGKLKNGKERASKRMVCLIIDNMVPIGWNSTLISMAERWARDKEASGLSITPRSIDAAAERDDAQLAEYQVEPPKASIALPATAATARDAQAPHEKDGTTTVQGPREVGDGDGSLVPRLLPADDEALEAIAAAGYGREEWGEYNNADSDDDFEVMPVSQTRSTQQQSREVTRPTSADKPNASLASSIPPAPPPPAPPPPLRTLNSDNNRNNSNTNSRQPTAPTHTYPPSTATPKPPIKLTPLKSIPSLPYKQNWSVNVVAVISAVSDLEPSYLPGLYAHQRQARLADPSTPKHVLLTVFLDPEEFSPAVGSVVLLLGVKNHMFDGGSLKKYASDRPKPGGGSRGGGSGGGLARALYGQGGAVAAAAGHGSAHGDSKNSEVVHGWWFENPVQFAWCDVAGLKTWWDSQQAQ